MGRNKMCRFVLVGLHHHSCTTRTPSLTVIRPIDQSRAERGFGSLEQ